MTKTDKYCNYINESLYTNKGRMEWFRVTVDDIRGLSPLIGCSLLQGSLTLPQQDQILSMQCMC